MGNLASLTFRLGADIKAFQTNMRKASATMRKVGKDMKRIGGQMSMYVTAPIVAMGAASLAAFDKQAQAEQQLAAQIRQNGKDVEATMASYKAYASSLQAVTTVGDETTLGLMKMAETMQANNTYDATQGAIGLSKALGVDLTSALKMVVLAQKGEYTMLNRYVPALRNANSETEKAAIVSKLYADGMEIAKTEAKTGLGPLKQLKNTIGDISEEFGALIADAIAPAVEWLKEAVAGFQGLSTKGKTTIAVVAGVAAAIGPLVVVLGTMLTVLPAIGAAFTAMLGPVGLIVAAIAAIAAAFIYVYGNWQAFKERLSNWAWLRNAAIDAFKALIKISSFFLNEISKLFGYDFVAAVSDELDKLKVPVEGVSTEFKSFGDTVKDVAGDAMEALGFLGSAANESFSEMATGMNNTTSAIIRMVPQVEKLKKRFSDVVDILEPETIKNPFPVDMEVLDIQMAHYLDMVRKFGKMAANNWTTAVESIEATVQQSLVNLGVAIGKGIGDLISGVDPNFGQEVLKVIAGFLEQIGVALITYGVLMLAFTLLAENPWTAAAAIVVGILAIAAAQALMNYSAEGPEGAKLATGGIVPGGFPNDTYPALLSSGETVIPAAHPLPTMGGGNMEVSGTLRADGKELLVLIDNASQRRKRTSGN